MTAGNVWPEDSGVLHLAQLSNRCTVLGPGARTVLWVQGCAFRCAGCVSPEMQSFEGGIELRVDTLVEGTLALPDIEGVTFSGGEPMLQAAALCTFVDHLRPRRDLSFLCYTGFTLEHLREHGTAAQRELLKRLDILIDGPYISSRHTDLRWRGSDNQRVHFLTSRYKHLASALNDRGSWLEFEFAEDGSLHWMGVPPEGFRGAFPAALKTLGIKLAGGGKGIE